MHNHRNAHIYIDTHKHTQTHSSYQELAVFVYFSVYVFIVCKCGHVCLCMYNTCDLYVYVCIIHVIHRCNMSKCNMLFNTPMLCLHYVMCV